MIEVRGFPARDGPLDLIFHPGDIILLRGSNGSGKTSLLRALAGLDAPLRPDAVLVEGRSISTLDVAELSERVQLATQDPRDGLVGLTVAGESKLRRRDVPPENLAIRHRDLATLSSGEARRVSLAITRATASRVLLLDEPIEGLDEEGRAGLEAHIRDAGAQGRIVLMADHAGILSRVANRVIDLDVAPAARARTPPPRAVGAPFVRAPACAVRRAERVLRLPDVSWGSGLHVVSGPNGSGKTTFLERLAGLTDAHGVTVEGGTPRPGENVTMLPARARDVLTEPTVAAELAGADPAIVERLVPTGLGSRHPLALSGGEMQRVALAAVLSRTNVHLLDEPEAHLDAHGRDALHAVILDRVAAGACIVIATHDPDLIASASTRTTLEVSL